MSSLTVCALKPHNCISIEVVWTSTTGRFFVMDETGNVGKRSGYGDVVAAMNAAARLATKRYAERLNAPL